MLSVIKVVISAAESNDTFCVELAFGVLRRNVFADHKLDVYILTSEPNRVEQTAVHVENCCFPNLNELKVTDDYYLAFRNAEYFLLMTNNPKPNAQQYNFVEDFQNLTQVFEMGTLFDRLAKPNARVLVMGPLTNVWLLIFGELVTILPKCNFTGLSRHYLNKALALIARKLDCEVRELSDVYIWGKDYLDLNSGKKLTTYAPSDEQRKYGLQCNRTTQNLLDILPSEWIDNFLTPRFQMMDTKTDRYCIVSAACQHMGDWFRGTGGRIVSMVTLVTVTEESNEIHDCIYSSCPVVVDETGEITAVQNIKRESSLSVKLNKFYENQQKEKYAIGHFLKITNKATKNRD